jgi:hypothetical protein
MEIHLLNDKGVLKGLGLSIFYSQERCDSFVPFTLLYRSDWFSKKIRKNWIPKHFFNGSLLNFLDIILILHCVEDLA